MQGMSLNKLTLVGGGSNSQIYSYGQAEQQVVLKVVSAVHKKQLRHLKNQFSVVQCLHHRNVIKALRYRQNVAFQGNKTDKQLLTNTANILVLEHASKGSLLSYIQTQQPQIGTKRRAFKQVALALAYLHSEGVVHRDLKLQNVLVFHQDTSDTFKISDFGFATRFDIDKESARSSDYKGTRKGYMAPEIHNCSKNRQEKYDMTKADIFALGVILFALVFGHLPFEFALPTNPLYKLIMAGQLESFWLHHKAESFESEKGYRMSEMKELFERMVNNDPSLRPSAEEVLKSEWLQE